jgi:hypothetical protein
VNHRPTTALFSSIDMVVPLLARVSDAPFGARTW